VALKLIGLQTASLPTDKLLSSNHDERKSHFPNRTRSVERVILSLCLLLTTAALIRAERLPVHVYTTAEGLASSAVNWLMRDSRGFLWFVER
jgi:hypothetical protein